MKHKLLVIIPAVFIICCAQKKAPKEQTDVPEALQENKKGEFSILSKRRQEDVISGLYNEAVTADKNLQQLEKDITAIKRSEQDSTADLEEFLYQNNHYYQAAGNHISLIKDSVLRKRIEQLITASSRVFETKISPHNNLLKTIAQKDIQLSDLHTSLMLVKTLTMMEKYQQTNLPSTKPLQNINAAYSKLVSTADTLMSKH